MSVLEHLHHPEKYWKILFKWGILGTVMGIFGITGRGISLRADLCHRHPGATSLGAVFSPSGRSHDPGTLPPFPPAGKSGNQ